MASSDETPTGHPILGAVVGARALVAGVREHPVWSLDAAATREVLVEVTRLTAQVVELQTRLLTHADQIDAYPGLSVANGLEHPGCDVPTARCHLHHHTPWSHGGTTDLANAVWLCPRHHHDTHRAHDGAHTDPVLRT